MKKIMFIILITCGATLFAQERAVQVRWNAVPLILKVANPEVIYYPSPKIGLILSPMIGYGEEKILGGTIGIQAIPIMWRKLSGLTVEISAGFVGTPTQGSVITTITSGVQHRFPIGLTLSVNAGTSYLWYPMINSFTGSVCIGWSF